MHCFVERGKLSKSRNKKSFRFIHFIYDSNTVENKSGGVGTQYDTIQQNDIS